jgi:hypothetical protein
LATKLDGPESQVLTSPFLSKAKTSVFFITSFSAQKRLEMCHCGAGHCGAWHKLSAPYGATSRRKANVNGAQKPLAGICRARSLHYQYAEAF